MEVWDPATESFGPAVFPDQGRFGHTATLLPDGRVLLVGGEGDGFDAQEQVWDPATGSLEPTGSLAEGRALHSATLLPDGRVLVVGGDGLYSGRRRVPTAEVWDPATASFAPAGSLVEARRGHTATLLPDGRVLVVGGARGGDFGVIRASAEIWEPGDG